MTAFPSEWQDTYHEMPCYHETHTCWVNYKHKHLNASLSPQESTKDPKSPLYQELSWESEEEGRSPIFSWKEASSVIYPNAENSSVICRHKKIPHPADPAPTQTLIWYDMLVLL